MRNWTFIPWKEQAITAAKSSPSWVKQCQQDRLDGVSLCLGCTKFSLRLYIDLFLYSEPVHMKTFIYQINVGKQKVKRIILLFYYLCSFLVIFWKSSFGHKVSNTLKATNKKLLFLLCWKFKNYVICTTYFRNKFSPSFSPIIVIGELNSSWNS